MLKLANNLSLPLDFVTERIAFLARTGAGKSGGMRVLFEQIVDNHQFAIFIDPKGDAYGIRAEGIGKGKSVLVMGGDHGDVPLEATAGKVIAEFLVTERVSTVLDISDFGKADMVRFVTDLCRTLYQRNRDVCHVFIDEADMVAGEKFYDPKCLEAIQLIQNKGRHRGFGVTVATQRSAMINKSVLFASGTLIAMQTTSPKDIATIREWLEVCSTKEIAKEIVAALPTLKTREAIVYSPQTLPEPVRITFDTFQTFDSMRTPKPGEARQQPKSLADIDLSAIQRDMAATIEKVKGDDPALLKKKIRDLETQLHQRPTVEPVEVEVPVFPDDVKTALLSRLEAIRHSLDNFVFEATTLVVNTHERVDDMAAIVEKEGANLHSRKMDGPPLRRPIAKMTEIERREQAIPSEMMPQIIHNADNSSLNEGERRILTCIAQDGRGVTTENIAVLTGYKATSRRVYLNNLARKGFVEKQGNNFFPLPAGITALGDFEPLPTGPALREYWLEKLTEGESRIFRVLIEHYPGTVDAGFIAEQTGYKATSIRVYTNNLVTRKLAVKISKTVGAADDLF